MLGVVAAVEASAEDIDSVVLPASPDDVVVAQPAIATQLATAATIHPYLARWCTPSPL